MPMPNAKRLIFLADLIAAAIFAVMFGTIIAQTAMRYLFRAPLATSLEFATILFVWLIFWAASFNLTMKNHFRFDVLYNALPAQLQRVFNLITYLTFFVIFCLAAKATWEYFLFLELQKTPSLQWTYQVAFSIYFIFFLALPARLLVNIGLLLSPRWREAL
jgi:TRAP-type C4-dicarboxylate transport system permease small subunit